MPDVIIKGMEMPKSCFGCDLARFLPDGDPYCVRTMRMCSLKGDRPKDCPLRPAPEWISVEERTENNDHNAVTILDRFTKAFCRDVSVVDDLAFRCLECPFRMQDGKCQVKKFKNKFDPDYKDFGSMGDLQGGCNMTFREKLAQDRPDIKDTKLICPKTFGYEEFNKCCPFMECEECWDREIPETCNQPCNDCKPACNQTAKADAGKPRLTLVPQQIIWDIAEVREYGNRKYPDGGPDNWKQVEAQRYVDAAFRHFLAYLRDPEGVDAESGIKHRKHLECNLAFLAELEDGNAE